MRACIVQGERMWEFAVALLLLDVVSDSIFLVGAYGFGEALVTMLGGAQVGRWIDTTDRLVGAWHRAPAMASPPNRRKRHGSVSLWFGA